MTGSKLIVAKDVHDAKYIIETLQTTERLQLSKPLPIILKCFFIGLFTEFDAFIGDLLKTIYKSKPDLFKGIKRELSLSELLEFGDIEAVKQDMLDKEVDSLRRNSYIEQLDELSKRFSLSTLNNFPEWPHFVEMGQRRNLMTHNDGIVSQQYLTLCEREQVKFTDKPKIGDQLDLDREYIEKTNLTLSKIGFMLTHTLWRKVLPETMEEADNSANETIYELMQRQRWMLAAELGAFALKEPILKKTKDISKRIRVINVAIALKFSNKADDAQELLSSVDWSASVRDFQLACAILNDDYPSAIAIMKQIGKQGELVTQLAYHQWPLFTHFRETIEFQAAYKEIYDEDFLKEVVREVNSHTDSLNKEVREKKKGRSKKIVN